MSVCLSVRMGQLGSHWKDFREIWHLSIVWKSGEKMHEALKFTYDNIGYFTWKPMYIYDISLIST